MLQPRIKKADLLRLSDEVKQVPDRRLVIHRDMEIAARDAHVGVASGVPDLGRRPTTGQGMADKRVATVVDGQSVVSGGAEDRARRSESLAKRVAGERLDGATRNQRSQERLVVFGAGAKTVGRPRRQAFSERNQSR